MEIDGSPDAIDRSISAYQAFDAQEKANVELGRRIAALLNASPEIPVTAEMIAAGIKALDAGDGYVVHAGDVSDVYRAMAALAPAPPVSEPRYDGGPDHLAALSRERDEAYGYLRRVFEHVAPQCTPLDDLMGICTQVDNALAGARIDAGNERAEKERWLDMVNKLTDWNSEYGAKNERLQDEVDALTIEKNALQDRVSAFTAANVPDPPKPDPIANAIRDRAVDRRRVGL